jgi:hypothetical protein
MQYFVVYDLCSCVNCHVNVVKNLTDNQCQMERRTNC